MYNEGNSPSLDLPKDPIMREVVLKEQAIRRNILPDGLIGQELTGFFETLGPKRIESASNEINPFWVNKLKIILYHEKQQQPLNNKKIQLLNSIIEYPANSNNENYILLPEFLSDTAVQDIWRIISTKLFLDVTKRDVLINDINKRHVLSLMVLISRNSKDGFIFTNKDRELNESLNTQFFQVKYNKDYSSIIRNIFINYINTSKTANTFILEYINTIIGRNVGKYIWKIYKNEFQGKNESSFSEELIMKRTILWLQNKDDPLPMEYFFDIYSERERLFIMREKNMCKEISDITNQMGKYSIPNTNLTINKIAQAPSTFSYSSGPNILKNVIKERNFKYFEENRQPQPVKSSTIKSKTKKQLFPAHNVTYKGRLKFKK